VTNRIWSSHFAPDLGRHRLARLFAVRGLALVYLVAVVSWWSQAAILVGEEGLAPAGEFLDFLRERLGEAGRSPFLALPSLFWIIGASDAALHLVCAAGVVLALLVLAGWLQGPSLIGLWVVYLSLVSTGGVFMSFQWDILLLETGFLAIFLADWRLRSPFRDPPPLGISARVALVGFWLLAAKLMFFSGWVKLAWAGQTHPEWWPELTAMTCHYMTQPIPTWTAWHMHHLPEGFHRFSLWPMYFVELVLPFAIVFGRYGRGLAATGFTGLMLLIIVTGNYTYFNWLTIVLCLPLVDDRLWPARLRRALSLGEEAGTLPSLSHRRLGLEIGLVAPPALVLLLLNLHIVLGDLHHAPNPLLSRKPTPGWLDGFRARFEPFRLASGYGLFRTMTTTRPEIVLEGSRDGVTWFEYDFTWKAGDLGVRPGFVAPHQPRVAWQFWFAALEGRFDPRSRNSGWIERLVLKLLRGDGSIDPLLRRNPFPDSPPRFVRGRLYEYRFTTPDERRRTGDWWRRVAAGEYLPAVSLPPGDPAR